MTALEASASACPRAHCRRRSTPRARCSKIGDVAIAMNVERGDAGLYVPALDLWLDPRRDVARAFVSHAHGDHAEAHGSGVIYGSRETLALVAARRKVDALPGARAIDWDASVELPVDARFGGGTARLSISPAGHVLGAAQLVIDHPGGRLVYTGDYRTGGGDTHAVGAPVACDVLVLESTFALPIFRFPPRDAVRAALVAWCRAEIDDDRSPVVLAYALGKSQEVIVDLLAAGLPVIAHGAVYAVCAAYEALGKNLGVADGRLRAYADSPAKKGEKTRAVLVVPPRARAQMTKKRESARVAYVSGWALIDAAIEQHRADAAFVLSDHADHPDLMATAKASGARRIYTAHGDALSLAHLLRREGIEAVPLEGSALDLAEDQA